MDSVEVYLAVLAEGGAFRMNPLAIRAVLEDGARIAASEGKLRFVGVFAVSWGNGTNVRLLSERYAALQFDAQGYLLPGHLQWLSAAMSQDDFDESDPPPWRPGPKQRVELLEACGVEGNLLRLVTND